MRDPMRISRILDKVEAIWINNPDLRLGQILVNLAPPRLNNDIFYWEDDELEEALEAKIDDVIKRRD